MPNATDGMNFKLYLLLINLTLNGHMWLEAIESALDNFQNNIRKVVVSFIEEDTECQKLGHLPKLECGKARMPASNAHGLVTREAHPSLWLCISFQIGSESLSFFLHPYRSLFPFLYYECSNSRQVARGGRTSCNMRRVGLAWPHAV